MRHLSLLEKVFKSLFLRQSSSPGIPARHPFDRLLKYGLRYHIGESMLPSVVSFFEFIDLDEKLRKHGFCPKVRSQLDGVGVDANQSFIAQPGAAVKFNQRKREGCESLPP
jgi:hypothetical protein